MNQTFISERPWQDHHIKPRGIDLPTGPGLPGVVWRLLVGGYLSTIMHLTRTDRSTVFCRWGDAVDPKRAMTADEAFALERSLCGLRHKVVSAELGVSLSRVSELLGRAAGKLELPLRAVPVPLVALAQSAYDLFPPVAVSCAIVNDARFLMLEVGRAIPTKEILTHAEASVAALFVEGFTRREISVARGTSSRTVACQLGRVFATLRVSNRAELIGAFGKRGWLSCAPARPADLVNGVDVSEAAPVIWDPRLE